MADNRKVSWAEVELRWYFGEASKSAAGDLGMRGIDYAAMAANATSRTGVDIGMMEERMARASDAVRKWRRIHATLAKIGDHAAVLWMVFGQRDIRPGIPAHIRLSRSARGACRAKLGHAPTDVEFDQWLLETTTKRADLAEALLECDRARLASVTAYIAASDRSARRMVEVER